MATANLDAICEFVTGARADRFPDEVTDAARRCIVDWAAVCIAALDEPGARLVRDYVNRWRGQGGALSFYGDQGPAATVALVNGTLSHCLDYDDLHLDTVFHATGPTLAAALAAGMDRGCDGRAILTALVVGFEVGTAAGMRDIGIGLAHHGWHPTGTLGHFSAFAAVASLLRLDRRQLAHGVGLAATQAAGLTISGGSAAKPFHVGKAAMNGVMAAELAECGVDASTDVLDDAQAGVLATLLQREVEPAFADLGRVWQITRNSFKPYPACQLTHAPFEAARKLAGVFDSGTARAVRAYVNPLAIKIAGKTKPRTPIEGKFSIAYCVALGLRGLAGAPGDFAEARLRDPAITAAADLVEVVPTEAIERWASRVELVDDGGTQVATVAAALGSLERPLDAAALEAKFMQVAEPAYGDRARTLYAALRAFDEPGRLAEIAAILASPARDAGRGQAH